MSPGAPPFEHPNALKIFGPPGSGKTRELIRILREHVDDGDFRLHDGIIVSFTRAAAHDIARRVNPDGEPGRYHCTLHALCKRYYGFDTPLAEPRLREFFAERNILYSGSSSGDPEEWAPSESAQKSEGAVILSFWNMCRNRLLPMADGLKLFQPEPEAARWWVEDQMEKLWNEYLAWKADEGLIDFTDMLEFAAKNPPAGGQWAYFVMDECQDSTPLQWKVANSFAASADIAYLAGDEDQAIYTWAGATPYEFLVAETPETDILHVNHRSGQTLVDQAQSFIRRNHQRQDKAMVAARPGGLIERMPMVPLLNPAESTFVMARAHYLNKPVMEHLAEIGYPFVDKRGSYGVTGKASMAYGRYLRLSKGQALLLDEWRLLLDAIPSNGPWLTRGTKKRLRELDKEFRHSAYIRVNDLPQYGATEDLVNAVRAGSVDPLERLDQSRLLYFHDVAERFGIEYLDERRAGALCSVGPIHAFKGLEAQHAVIHTGMPPAATRESHRDPEPERRVLYVAMTRAIDRITYYEGKAFNTWEGLL